VVSDASDDAITDEAGAEDDVQIEDFDNRGQRILFFTSQFPQHKVICVSFIVSSDQRRERKQMTHHDKETKG